MVIPDLNATYLLIQSLHKHIHETCKSNEELKKGKESMNTVLQFLMDDPVITHKNWNHIEERMRPYFEDLLIGRTFEEGKRICREMHLKMKDTSQGMTLTAMSDTISCCVDNDIITQISMIDFDPYVYDIEWLKRQSNKTKVLEQLKKTTSLIE